MTDSRIVGAKDGVAFEDGLDRGRILVSGRDTDGLYSLMDYVVAPADPKSATPPAYGAHRHREIEETFLIRRGTLAFLLDDTVRTLKAGDLVRVPPGVRHGYANLSEEPVEMLVSFHPGGFEELFVKYRSDQDPPPAAEGFIEEAMRLHASEFER